MLAHADRNVPGVVPKAEIEAARAQLREARAAAADAADEVAASERRLAATQDALAATRRAVAKEDLTKRLRPYCSSASWEAAAAPIFLSCDL